MFNSVRQHRLSQTLGTILVFGFLSTVALAGDLSRYRDFQLGTDLPTVARQTGARAVTTVIHQRPVLIQELVWRPRPHGSPSAPESVREVVFGFYDGELFRIAVHYDRYETVGLTANDIVTALSAAYGAAVAPANPAETRPRFYGDEEDILARWQDPLYRFDLFRSSYGPSYKLVGVLKRLETPMQTAMSEAERLDAAEAPQREVEKQARAEEAERVKQEKARSENKPKFRP